VRWCPLFLLALLPLSYLITIHHCVVTHIFVFAKRSCRHTSSVDTLTGLVGLPNWMAGAVVAFAPPPLG